MNKGKAQAVACTHPNFASILSDAMTKKAGGFMCQKEMQNPSAASPLIVPIAVLRNTPRDEIDSHIRTNAARDLHWIGICPAHDKELVIVGGGASARRYLDEIKARKEAGAQVYALNGASQWLRERGIDPGVQVMVDARIDSLHLLDPEAFNLLASQVHPDLVEKAGDRCALFHIAMLEILDLLPEHRREDVPLIGGGVSVGMAALCIAFVQGFRTLHLYGYDSSHEDGASHAYPQPMNDKILTVQTDWDGQVYTSSVAMKAQAEWFFPLERELRSMGCKVHLHGEGLLPAMVRTTQQAESLREREKYRIMWGFKLYREYSPGEKCVAEFLEVVKPDGLVADFGCGTGRAGLAIEKAGLPVFLFDFAGNCRDSEAYRLPFCDWDMSQPCPIKVDVKFGFCTDVMEHIPPEQVDAVLANIFAAAPRVFFQISTVEDGCGEMILGHPLHLSVHPHAWWRDKLLALGRIEYERDDGDASIFYVVKE